MVMPCRRELDRYGTLVKHGKKYGGVFGKARHTFCHVFYLGITTLSNIATKVSFSEWAATRGLCLCSAAQRSLSHELRTSSSSQGIACSGDGDGSDDDSNSYSGGGGNDDYCGGGVDGDNGGGDGSSDGGGHKQQTTIT
jgi:hypothetical protein